jgi:carbamoyltransferase
MKAGCVGNGRFPVPFLGPAHPADSIDRALAEVEGRIEVLRFAGLDGACADVAERIAGGQVVAWYRGRMEFGPRALGHRSILADPGRPEMRDRINAMVKMREAFRPFAPAVTLEEAHLWFDIPPMFELPYMILVVNVREQYRAELPAITHVDGSARVQTVSSKDNADFHTLLRTVGKRLGKEMVLNTSFNVKGQPIVNTPAEAIDTFLRTGMDCLFLENTRVTRRS